MKKNLMSVLILALVVANLILTAILMISVVPQTKKANELINKVCSAIDLELEGGKENSSIDIPMEQVETVQNMELIPLPQGLCSPSTLRASLKRNIMQ